MQKETCVRVFLRVHNGTQLWGQNVHGDSETHIQDNGSIMQALAQHYVHECPTNSMLFYEGVTLNVPS